VKHFWESDGDWEDGSGGDGMGRRSRRRRRIIRSLLAVYLGTHYAFP